MSRLLQLEQYYAATPHLSFSFALPRSAPPLPRGNDKTKRPERQGHADRMAKRRRVMENRIQVTDWMRCHPWNAPVWKSEKLEKPEKPREEMREIVQEIENSPLNHNVETVETVETPVEASVTQPTEPTQVEPTQVEPNVEPPRVSLKQKLRKNILFRFHSPVCWTPSSLGFALVNVLQTGIFVREHAASLRDRNNHPVQIIPRQLRHIAYQKRRCQVITYEPFPPFPTPYCTQSRCNRVLNHR